MTNDYVEWGETYLREAAVLKTRLDRIRNGNARTFYTASEKRRMRMLYEMYLECCAIGRLLQKRGGRRLPS